MSTDARDLTTEVLSDAVSLSPEEAWLRLERSDLTLVSLPEELGGSGGDLTDAAGILFATAASGLSLPLPETAWLAGWLTTGAGRDAPSGTATVAVADSSVRAARSGAGWQLEGTLDGVRWGDQVSELYVVLPDDGVCVVAARSGALDTSLGTPTSAVRLDDTSADWFPVSPDVVEQLDLRLALARSAQIAGAAAGALDLAVRYAAERVQFGRPLTRFQVIQHHLARVAAQCHGATSAVEAAVAAVAADPSAAPHAARIAKAVTSAAVEDVATLTHQVIGAIGTTREHPLHRFTMNLWAWRDDAGDEFTHAGRLADAALGDDVWSFVAPVHSANSTDHYHQY